MPLHFHFISAVHIWFISYIINTHFFDGNIWTHNWPAPNVSGFIAQLVEHRTGNREVTGSKPVEVLNFFQASLRNCINCVHCDDHFFISINTNFSLKAKRWLRGGVGGHVGVSTNPVRFELFSYVNAFFCSIKFAKVLATWVKTLYNGFIFHFVFRIMKLTRKTRVRQSSAKREQTAIQKSLVRWRWLKKNVISART